MTSASRAKPPRPPPRRTRVLLVMPPAAHRAMAIRWAKIGFAASGRGFNGETAPGQKYPAADSSLDAYFGSIYDKEKWR